MLELKSPVARTASAKHVVCDVCLMHVRARFMGALKLRVVNVVHTAVMLTTERTAMLARVTEEASTAAAVATDLLPPSHSPTAATLRSGMS